MADSTATHERAASERVSKPAGFAHASIPVRDRQEAKRFFMDVLSGELVLDNPTFVEVRVGGVVFGFSEQTGGWTPPDAEFPHYAFFVEPDDMAPLKERLEAHGVKTHPIWTRNQREALMYFRDPSGNMFELYCPEGFKDVEKLPRAVSTGGDFTPPIASLSYDWKG